ncbi:alpha-amylase/4-alpha-glucanotransferase domain-containing protein [Anatilimnocola floriformis]|uniref:alpha-amylase/4-alpha-glucanotransferase domain-containing protein n=1 Tax=Anatilimnocola floriformis TaxID=2948575 RepID=UPI0020C53181|nr:alpha-amylase/4-alpha-glucanotransferase domain-containing protein [Anatilimnocola floriformis]
MNPIRLCLVLHNHQPVGNFDGVFEQAYQDSYLPFLDVFESYSDLKISLHTSGPLMEWLDERHGEYIDRVARLVRAGRIEIVGGPFYEPILTMIPPRDRVGQITTYSRWLENRLGANVQGMWMPERVWEQSLTGDLVAAGMKYTVLDDFHFKNAGLTEDQLHGYYLTEDDGRVLCVFPGSEPLRYTIPFQSPQASIDYLRGIHAKFPGAVVVFGDDGEKFGTWPDTKKHVYENGWLRQFFDALLANRDWLQMSTLAEANESTPPVGKIYLPDGSYREMTEWALPVNQQLEYDHVVHELEHDHRWPQIKRFVRGGFWRNFKVKYPETNEMYSRMMMTSKRFAQAERDGVAGQAFENARQALYRGQCNCPYWHGAFGGIYLPHLRNAIFNQLIAADNLIDQAAGKTEAYVEATTDDYNFDLKQEVRLASDKLIALLAPAQGGMLYELDVRSICHNLGATLTRRPESYHRKVLAGPAGANGSVSSIHDRVVFKQPGLDQRLQYDPTQRKSLLDHFYDLGATLQGVSRGEARELGDFINGVYEAKIRRAADRIQVQLTRPGHVNGHEIRITKAVTMMAGSQTMELTYQLENLPPHELLHFAVELNFAGLPSGADDRYFHNLNGIRYGQLGTQLDLQDANQLGLTDEWLGIDVQMVANRQTSFWTFPIETVSQSEGGFELVHQSVAVLPHWHVRGDAAGKWTATIQLTTSTAIAERRMQPERAAVMA